MNKRSLLLTLFIFCSLLTTGLHAQESFISDINYPYLDKLIATAKRNYPEIKLRQSQVNIAKTTLSQTRVMWLDAFTASYIYSQRNSINVLTPTLFNGYQLTATVNLASLFSKPLATRNARESVNIAQYQQTQSLLAIEANVKRLYFAYLAAQADLRVRTKGAIDGETAVKQLKYTFQKGETTFQVYNEALTSLYNQNSYRVNSELSMLMAKANLEEVLGVRLEDVK